MAPEEVKQVYPDKHDNVTLVCHECGHVHRIDASPYKAPGRSGRLSITCVGCGHALEALISFRKHYRKETNLSGTCTTRSAQPNKTISGEFSGIVVKNISLSGIGFIVKSPIHAKEGDILNVTFKLDDSKRTVISKQVIVRRIIDNLFAAEFTPPMDPTGSSLAFYLRFSQN
ncbi:MAG: PilZ domain-containing protein [Deltaproteobacteria bacterium]|nr:PilZ domain-containing protein [Deltaproteobacteria bacterium]